MVKKSLLACAALLACASTSLAGEVTLCSGRAGGGYDTIIQGLGAELEAKGHSVSVINFGGSEDILNNLQSGKCAYGPAQKDIYYLMQDGLPKVSATVAMYNEVMQMACTTDTGVDELDEIDSGFRVIVDSFGSGSAKTWENMVAIENGEDGNQSPWSHSTPIYTPLDEAAAAVSVGKAECVFGVSKLPASWMQEVLNQGAYVVWIYDKDLDDLEYSGGPLYPSIRVPSGPYPSKFDTYKIPSVLFRSNTVKVDTEIDKLVKRVVPALSAKVNTVK